MLPTIEVDHQDNPTELYTAICSEAWDEAAFIVKHDPAQVKIWIVRNDTEDKSSNIGRFLPLHAACSRQPPESFIELLLSTYPEAASIVDGQGYLSLHYACVNRANEGVINFLLIIHPDGAKVRDSTAGKLPLHHLSHRGPHSIGALYFLLSVYPQGVNEKDNSGYTPMEITKFANYPGRESVLNAFKPVHCINPVASTKCEESWGVIAQEEKKEIGHQEKTIERKEKEIKAAHDELERLRNRLQDERSGTGQLLSQEIARINDAMSALKNAESELETMRKNRFDQELELKNNRQDMKNLDAEIISIKQQKRQMNRERIVLKEKLTLKLEIHQETVSSLQSRFEEERKNIELSREKVKVLEDTYDQLNVDIQESVKQRETLEKEFTYLKECEEIVRKVDEMEKNVSSLHIRYEPCLKEIRKEQVDFTVLNVEREQKILELAELEAKIMQIEHDQILQEFKEQEKEMCRVVELIKGI